MNNEFQQAEVLNVFPDIKPRALQHLCELGIIKPLRDSTTTGIPRVYSYANLIQIGITQQLLSRNMALREVKSIMARKDLQNRIKAGIKAGDFDFLYHLNTNIMTAISSKTGKAVASYNVPFSEGCVEISEYDPQTDKTTFGIFINVKRIVDHINARLNP